LGWIFLGEENAVSRILTLRVGQRVTALVAATLIVMSYAVHAAPTMNVARIGFLGSGTYNASTNEPFLQGLRELGWVQGENIVIDYRFADGSIERLPGLTTELVRHKVDVIVAVATPSSLAARNATKTIPIVMVAAGDPVGAGLITNLARPGANVTGLSFGVGLESFTKSLELFKQVVPDARRVAVLTNPVNPAQLLATRDLEAAARHLGMHLQLVQVRGPDDFEAAFAAMTKERAGGLLVVTDPMFVSHRTRLADLAAEHRLPTMHGVRSYIEGGGLMSYGPNLADLFRRAATYVDKILKGAKPGELPVEQPTKFELVINLKTVRALGLMIPPSLLLRADEVIQ
jgi:putative ABC transport system substrate-binding protein